LLGWFRIFVLWNFPRGYDLLNFAIGTIGIVMMQLFWGTNSFFLLLGAFSEFQLDSF
jgi:hypothetical protein